MPLVSIGMPVFNGEQFIGQAIDSILQQSMTDIEIVICDNASTDRTEEICRQYAERDSRVRYYRNAENLGAHPNYNKTFHLSSGKYFKWAPHDDVLKESFLKECVAVLEADAGLAVCQTLLLYIDDDGNTIGHFDSRLRGSDSPSPAVRLGAVMLTPHPAYEVMGVFRRSALEGLPPLGSFHGADRALLAELALRGRFACVYQPLLVVRDHKQRYTRSQATPRDRAVWHDAKNQGKLSFRAWRLYGNCIRSVGSNINDPGRECFATAS